MQSFDPGIVVSYHIAELRLSLALAALSFLEIKAGFRQDQARGCDGRWCDESGSLGVIRKDRTGDPKIDAMTDQIVDVLRETIAGTEAGDGFLYGIKIHGMIAARLRELDLPGIGKHGVEQSFIAGDIVRHGLQGSIRTDVMLRNGRTSAAPIVAIWDIKTGNRGLSAARVRALRAGAGVDGGVPVIEIHLIRGISVKGRSSITIRVGGRFT